MRTIKHLFFMALLLFAGIAQASTSAATATITDADGNTWNNCTWSAALLSPKGPPTVSGSPVPVSSQKAHGTCDDSGALSVTLTDTSTIDQANAAWQFTLTPNASVATSSVVTTTVVGATPDLSSVLSAGTKLPRFLAGLNSYGYSDAEVLQPISLGSTYFNVISGLRQFSLKGWAASSSGSPYNPAAVAITGGTAILNTLSTKTHCSGGVPLDCGSAASGLLLVSAAASGNFVITTTAATANSSVFFSVSGICGALPDNIATLPLPIQVSSTAGAFTMRVATAPTTNPACWNFFIVSYP